jgi:mRNA interferase RelE/StbE
MKTIVFGPSAAKDYDALPDADRSAVRANLHRYAIDGDGAVKRLSGSTYMRLRVGRYRVLFAEDGTTILALYVGKRETTTYRKGRT